MRTAATFHKDDELNFCEIPNWGSSRHLLSGFSVRDRARQRSQMLEIKLAIFEGRHTIDFNRKHLKLRLSKLEVLDLQKGKVYEAPELHFLA